MEGVVEVVEVGCGERGGGLAWSLGRKELGLEDSDGALTIIGIYHVVVLKGRLLVVVSPACGSHCMCGLSCTLERILEAVVCLTKSMLSQSPLVCVNGRRLAMVEEGVCK